MCNYVPGEAVAFGPKLPLSAAQDVAEEFGAKAELWPPGQETTGGPFPGDRVPSSLGDP